jgi:hypothetical protein
MAHRTSQLPAITPALHDPDGYPPTKPAAFCNGPAAHQAKHPPYRTRASAHRGTPLSTVRGRFLRNRFYLCRGAGFARTHVGVVRDRCRLIYLSRPCLPISSTNRRNSRGPFTRAEGATAHVTRPRWRRSRAVQISRQESPGRLGVSRTASLDLGPQSGSPRNENSRCVREHEL